MGGVQVEPAAGRGADGAGKRSPAAEEEAEEKRRGRWQARGAGRRGGSIAPPNRRPHRSHPPVGQRDSARARTRRAARRRAAHGWAERRTEERRARARARAATEASPALTSQGKHSRRSTRQRGGEGDDDSGGQRRRSEEEEEESDGTLCRSSRVAATSGREPERGPAKAAWPPGAQSRARSRGPWPRAVPR